MKSINGYKLYEYGYYIHQLESISEETSDEDAYFKLLSAKSALNGLYADLKDSMITSFNISEELYIYCDQLIERYEESEDRKLSLSFLDVYSLKEKLNKLEHIISAEFATMPLYATQQVAAFDARYMVPVGHLIFPRELQWKVPEAIKDIQQATKCLAFELPTASAFHLFRAVELVLKRYFISVTNKKKTPSNGLGSYFKELEKCKFSNQKKKDTHDKILSSLRDLKNLHRNPIVHPENSLETTEEAVALLGCVISIITYILKTIETFDAHIDDYHQFLAEQED